MKTQLIHVLLIADLAVASSILFSLKLEFAVSILFVAGFLAIFAQDYSRASDSLTTSRKKATLAHSREERLPLAS